MATAIGRLEVVECLERAGVHVQSCWRTLDYPCVGGWRSVHHHALLNLRQLVLPQGSIEMGGGISDTQLKDWILSGFSTDTRINTLMVNPRTLTAHVELVTNYQPGAAEY